VITTPFGASSTAAEVIAGVDLTGKRAIVTGASSGIGVETARALAAAGAAVTLAVRDTQAGARVAADIKANTGNDAVTVGALELADLASVHAFAAARTGALDILVNNAGVMAIPELTISASGHEMQFATNHLGHFALALALRDALAAAGSARIVSVSSGGHLRSPVVFDDIDYAFRDYDPFGAYGQSKTANVLFAVEATRRWAADGIVANALMPGAIVTQLGRHVDMGKAAAAMRGQRAIKTVEQGAATSVLLAASPLLDGVGGRYFENCNEAELVSRRGAPGSGGVAPYALDPANAERLGELSLRMVADA
jgi:NAD(P)-dependent dehydrogenase (short-subunit alcohol dehydrogenase family)